MSETDGAGHPSFGNSSRNTFRNASPALKEDFADLSSSAKKLPKKTGALNVYPRSARIFLENAKLPSVISSTAQARTMPIDSRNFAEPISSVTASLAERVQ